MYKVFNMGHRMEICLPEKFAESIISISKEFNVDARVIGHCEKAPARKLTIISPSGTFNY
jgi:phosphoribosylformylglycinamidine cyclo-ligase